jgi:hypothetical protein
MRPSYFRQDVYCVDYRSGGRTPSKITVIFQTQQTNILEFCERVHEWVWLPVWEKEDWGKRKAISVARITTAHWAPALSYLS